MSTLLEIKTEAAAYLGRDLADLTVGSTDLWLSAANRAVRMAELNHDFEFNRKAVTVTVNGSTGGNLTLAQDSGGNSVAVKTVIEVGFLDEQNNLMPVSWTTTAESLEHQRGDNAFAIPRYPRDGEVFGTPQGGSRLTFSGDEIHFWPKTDDNSTTDYPLWLEVYSFSTPWTSSSLAANAAVVTGTITPDLTGTLPLIGMDTNGANFYQSGVIMLYKTAGANFWYLYRFNEGGPYFSRASATPSGVYTAGGGSGAVGSPTVTVTSGVSDIWTTHGAEYLLWQTVVELNKMFKVFVPRQEGNLTPPTEMAQAGLQSLIDWDTAKFEMFRRHTR